MATADTVAGPVRSRRPNRTRDLGLFTAWVLGSYVLATAMWVVLPWLFLGWQPLLVTSGSMAPFIRSGDVVLVESVSHLVGEGTVVAFDTDDGLVVHRVLGANPAGYTTKGDANPDPDSSSVARDDVIGRGRLLVPYLGVFRVMGPGWWLALAALAALVVAMRWRGGGLATGAALMIVVGTSALAAGGGVFTDTTGNASNAISTVDPMPPTGLSTTCGLIGLTDAEIEITWSPSSTPGVTGYQVLHDGPSAGANFSVVGTTGAGVTSFTHTFTVALLGLGDHTYVVKSLVGPWESTMSASDAVNLVEVGVAYVCTEI